MQGSREVGEGGGSERGRKGRCVERAEALVEDVGGPTVPSCAPAEAVLERERLELVVLCDPAA